MEADCLQFGLRGTNSPWTKEIVDWLGDKFPQQNPYFGVVN